MLNFPSKFTQHGAQQKVRRDKFGVRKRSRRGELVQIIKSSQENGICEKGAVPPLGVHCCVLYSMCFSELHIPPASLRAEQMSDREERVVSFMCIADIGIA